MKKLFALLAISGFAFAFVACGKKSEPAAEAFDSTATTEEEVIESEVDTLAVDSASVQ